MIILEYMIISSNKKISIFLNINIFIKIYFTAFLLIIYDKLIFVDIMSLFDCLLKLFNKNQHQKIKPEINYLPCSKIHQKL